MAIKTIERSSLQRVMGTPVTQKPEVADCWNFEDGKLTIQLQNAPELKVPGGALRLEGNNLPVRVLVVNSEDGEYRAYHNRCTHIGHRRLDPVPGTNTVQCCSINHSTFDCCGEKMAGPARGPVKSFPIEKNQEKLIISISK